MSADVYNFDTFRWHIWEKGKHFRDGPEPGQLAPDFDLPTVAGGRFRLSDFRGKQPVLTQFGSIT
jgi:hypothetical protein